MPLAGGLRSHTVFLAGPLAARSGALILSDPDTGLVQFRLPVGTEQMGAHAFSPDGQSLAVYFSWRRTVALWDLVTRSARWTISSVHIHAGTPFRLSSAPALIALRNGDHQLRMVEYRMGRETGLVRLPGRRKNHFFPGGDGLPSRMPNGVWWWK